MAPGLEAAMERMSVGQSAMIFIPSWHAYGTTGKPPWIPPGADLIYLVDLLRIGSVRLKETRQEWMGWIL